MVNIYKEYTNMQHLKLVTLLMRCENEVLFYYKLQV